MSLDNNKIIIVNYEDSIGNYEIFIQNINGKINFKLPKLFFKKLSFQNNEYENIYSTEKLLYLDVTDNID